VKFPQNDHPKDRQTNGLNNQSICKARTSYMEIDRLGPQICGLAGEPVY